MSITSDIRSYADNAVAEGRKVLDSTLSNAQAQLNDVTGQANDIVGKATSVAQDLRTSAEKAVNVDAIKSAIEPYLEQASSYQATVQERAEAIFAELKKDPRFAKAFEVAEDVFEVVVETVQERVVKPVVALTGRDRTSSTTPRKPAPRKASATSASKPATKPSPTKSSAARKPAATKPAAKKATTARKAPAKRAPKA